jgi:inosose dehydratase
VQTEDEVDRLMDACDETVALLLDTGHLTFAGGDPVRAALRHAGRIAHVHCKDVRRPVLVRSLNRDSSFLDAVLDGVFTVPGDGYVDYPAVLAPLARVRYDGWLVVEAEQDPTVAPSAEYAALGFGNLRRFADAMAAP